MRQKLVGILLIVVMLSIVTPVLAHRVVTYAYLKGEQVIVEGAFGDGSPVIEGQVKVYNLQGDLINQGQTNQQGIYKFKLSKKAKLKIVLVAGAGHRAEYQLSKEDLPNLGKSDIQQIEETVSKEAKQQADQISEEKLRVVIQEELAKQLAPLRRKVAKFETERRPGVTEVIGGIGYIFGLMGLVFYFKTKRENKS
ncbi:hypothetical protein JCM16358_22650 [Halanaerocella petrolearia]